MRFLSLFLCSLIALSPICAQSSSFVPAELAIDAPLHVHLVDGQSSKGYVFQVTDGAGSPVPGAAVALRLPEEAPTGSFANGLRSSVAYSDAAGISRFPLIEWGPGAGQVQLKVSAAKGASHAALMIAQEVGVDKPSVRVVSVPVQAPPADAAPILSADPASGPHTLTPNPPPPSKEASSEPAVTITNTTTGAGGSASHKKLLLLVGLGAERRSRHCWQSWQHTVVARQAGLAVPTLASQSARPPLLSVISHSSEAANQTYETFFHPALCLAGECAAARATHCSSPRSRPLS